MNSKYLKLLPITLFMFILLNLSYGISCPSGDIPDFPHEFYGYVYDSDGTIVGQNVVVKASIDGNDFSITTDSNGGYGIDDVYAAERCSSSSATTVTFYVQDVLTATSATYIPKERALLNLTASASADICVDTDGDTYGSGCSAGGDCDDTDTAIYEGTTRTCEDYTVGVCASSTQTCGSDNAWAVCAARTTEACDGTLDEDCDGDVDEGCISGGATGGGGGGGSGSTDADTETTPEPEVVPETPVVEQPTGVVLPPADVSLNSAKDVIDSVSESLAAGTISAEEAITQLDGAKQDQENANVKMIMDTETFEALETVIVDAELGLNDAAFQEGRNILDRSNQLLAQAEAETDPSLKAALLKQATELQTQAMEKLPEIETVVKVTIFAEKTDLAVQNARESATSVEAKEAVEKASKGKGVNVEKSLETFKITNKELAPDKEVFKSKINLKIKPDKEARDVNIVETIPKSMAAHVSEVTFLGLQPQVLQADPIVQWSFDVVLKGEEKDMSYIVNKRLDTLDTVTVGAAQEVKSNLTFLFYGLILIILVGVFFYFYKKKEHY
ncbi:hypothetical protein HQ529_05015 [Candidatus Woesearchaeota archaeon]|nr:hypothetical protein [Candidatus Woesearchaeota archaeon]